MFLSKIAMKKVMIDWIKLQLRIHQSYSPLRISFTFSPWFLDWCKWWCLTEHLDSKCLNNLMELNYLALFDLTFLFVKKMIVP